MRLLLLFAFAILVSSSNPATAAIPNEPECADPDCSLAKLTTLRALASRGNKEASFSLGHIFMTNDSGVKQDFENAFYYFSKAARQGFAPANRQVAGMLARGIGTEVNMAEAKRVMRKAAERGVHKTAEEYAILVFTDENSTIDEYNDAIERLNAKVDAGTSYLANYLMAVLYIEGEHVTRDIDKALTLLEYPAQGNFANAQELITSLTASEYNGEDSTGQPAVHKTGLDPSIETIQVRGLSVQIDDVKELIIGKYWSTGRQTGSRIMGNGCTPTTPGCDVFDSVDGLNDSLHVN